MTTTSKSIYDELLDRTKDLMILQTAESIIQWDMETKMPPRAVEQRSLQLALISRIGHKMSTNPEIGQLLKQITADPNYETLDPTQKRNIYLIKKNYDEQTALPEKLVSEKAKQQAITVNLWKKAKKTQNYATLKPELKKLFDLSKKEAEILMKVKETSTSYDALIDNFEPKASAEQITPIFKKLQDGLRTLLTKIQNSQKQPDTNMLKIGVSIENQRKIAMTLTDALGYDTTSSNAAGRIDETEHPFTTGYLDDVRITTHYYQNDFTSSVFSILHETGHALYDQNLNAQWKYQPIGLHCSMGIHESQSRFTENIIGRSKEFWTGTLQKLKQITPELKRVELDPFIHAINTVQPSKIRIESDEVTYNMHIIIRFQLERDLFAEKIHVDELPQAWNQSYKQLLGLEIENDSEGVMQDTHWSSGYFGYFPSYTLGNIYSGQLLEKLGIEKPNWKQQMASGDMNAVMNWLKESVHKASNLHDPVDLIEKITGNKLDAQPYLNYLHEKYSKLYDF